MGYLFPQNGFKERLTRMNHIVIYLRKNIFEKVYRSLKKIKQHLKSVYIWHKRKEPFLENSSGEHILL